MSTFKLRVISAEGRFFDGECESLVFPTLDGMTGILADHCNMLGAVSQGIAEFTTPDGTRHCAAVDEALEAAICKNLLLCNRQRTAFYLLMIRDDKQFKTGDLSKQIGSSRLSFAEGQYMKEFLDITPGSLSVLGLMNDTENRVQLLIDEDILKSEYFGCHPCINTSSLRLRTRDLTEVLIPAMGHSYRIVSLMDSGKMPDFSPFPRQAL